MCDEQPVKFRHCPLCDAGTIMTIKHLCYALYDDSPLSDSYDLVSCNRCGFIFCDTKTTVNDFFHHYKQNKHYMAENCGTGAVVENEKERYASVLSILQKYQPNKKAKIVDIGSAKGGFVSYLKTERYTDLLAIDPLPECIDFIRSNGINAEIGSAEKLPMENGCANIAILSHVLEHIIDLQTVMNELERVIGDGGLVYAEVPTIEHGCSFEHAPMWDFLYEHINYFSTQNLISLFESKQFLCLEANINEIHNGDGIIKCVSAIFKKDEQAIPKNISFCDVKETIFNIQNPTVNVDAFLELEKIAEEKRPCYVWGISAYMQFLIANTPINKCNILSFLDKSKYKQTKTINNIPINSPDLLKEVSDNAVVVYPAAPHIAGMNQYLDEIRFAGKKIVV